LISLLGTLSSNIQAAVNAAPNPMNKPVMNGSCTPGGFKAWKLKESAIPANSSTKTIQAEEKGQKRRDEHCEHEGMSGRR